MTSEAAKSAQLMREDCVVIRKAWKAGKKKVMVRGVEFAMIKLTRKRTITMGGKLNADFPLVKLTNTDHWITTRPTDGATVPRHCVEETPGKNGFGTRTK